MKVLSVWKLFLWPTLVAAMMMFSVSAMTFGLFTYEVVDGNVIITDYPETEIGSVVIPCMIKDQPVTGIGNVAFQDCRGLTSIAIPGSVTSIGGGAFEGCYQLTDIQVAVENTTYSSLDGVLYNKALTTLVRCPLAKESVMIPNGILSIGDAAFRRCAGLTVVVIPASVTSIGDEAFLGCRNLASAAIPGNLFSIGSAAFQECSLVSVVIPNSVTSIGNAAFLSCSDLVSFSVAAENTVYSSLDGVLYNKAQTILIQCPARKQSVMIPGGVTTIANAAFRGCSSLMDVVIPASVTSIGDQVFLSCRNLTSTYFAGDAPATFGVNVFSSVAHDHIIYYLDTKRGFASPTWNGYPTQMIDTENYPAAGWLLESNLAYDTDLNQDLNGDGVSLLMAYALKLDPHHSPLNRLPQAEVGTEVATLQYYSGSAGITYRVETSKNMVTWVTTGITISPPDDEGIRTASIDLTQPTSPLDERIECAFLRLVVIEGEEE